MKSSGIESTRLTRNMLQASFSGKPEDSLEEKLDMPEPADEQADDLTFMFGLADDVSIAALASDANDEEAETAGLEQRGWRQIEREELAESGCLDPLKVYLQEMGAVSLLSRKGERELGRRMEAGSKRMQDAVLAAPAALPVLQKASADLREGRATIAQILKGLEEADEKERGRHRQRFLRQVASYSRLEKERAAWRRELFAGSSDRKISIRIEQHSRAMVALFAGDHLQPCYLDCIVKTMRKAEEEFSLAHAELLRAEIQVAGEPAAVKHQSVLLGKLEQRYGIDHQTFEKIMAEVKLGSQESSTAKRS